MKKNGTKRTLRVCLWTVALTMILVFGSLMSVQASATMDVSEYKGDRAKEEWIVPEEEGKIFAGWYEDAEFTKVYTGTTGNAYAKFVDEKVLTVKKQFKAGTTNVDATTNIRFLTAIDSLMFKGVTFDVQVPQSGKAWTKTETVAYSSMLVEGDETPKYAKDIFGTEDAKYFVAHSFMNIPNAAFGHGFTVTPSWETMDGTVVTGKVLDFTVNGELLAGSLFAPAVNVNGSSVSSALDRWVYNSAEQSVIGTDSTANKMYMDPIYFKETGNTMLLQTTITNVSNPMKGQPIAGVYITDGTNKGGFGFVGNTLKYGQWLDKTGATLSYDVLVSWGKTSMKLEVVLKDNNFHIYVDDVFVKTLSVNEVMFNGTSNGALALGLTMKAESLEKSPISMKFSGINFTTDATAVDAFLTSKQ